MMPSVLRQSGPKFIKDGAPFTPRAVIHICEGCQTDGANFGLTQPDGRNIYFCGYDQPTNTPHCIGRRSE